MIPSAWIFALLALAAYRGTRLFGWDEFPLAAKVRAWVIGEEWHNVTDPVSTTHTLLSNVQPANANTLDPRPSPPGKPPESDVPDIEPVYRRPTLAHLVHCPYCIGFYVSLLTCIAWWTSGSPGGHNLGWVGWVAFPLALSGAVGLISKNLDA